jgi:putative ABC transport system permease protein
LNIALLGVFAASALLLATLGVYGVVSYSVAQRAQEIGVRMALGAQASDIVALVLREGSVLAIAGIILGLVEGMLATRLLRSMLFDVAPTDAPTFAAVAAGLVVVTLAATYVPARRGAREDPLRAMRAE